MNVKWLGQGPQFGRETILDAVATLHAEKPVTYIRVAMAYVTISGVRALDKVLGGLQAPSQWVLGIDDAITQPGAIRLVQKVAHAQVKWTSLGSSARRYHPKVLLLERGGADAVLIVGSANLTAAAFRTNCEAVAFIEATTSVEVKRFRDFFDHFWRSGSEVDEDALSEYEIEYDRIKKLRNKIEAISLPNSARPSEILADDFASLDPSMAQTCWIECGYNTAQGRELEFKAEQGLFFGLPQNGGAAATFDFRVSDGEVVPLRLKYQGNHMWRLQLNANVPEVAAGLRPRMPDGSLGRSAFVAVIERTNAASRFNLTFVSLRSRIFRELIARSKRTGTYGRTSARQYGWCS